MIANQTRPAGNPFDLAAWILTGIALLMVLLLHLLPALLAGLLIYEMVDLLAPRLRIVRIRKEQGKLAAVGVLAIGVILVLLGIVIAITAFVRSETGSIPMLLQKMADIIDRWRTVLPAAVVDRLPEGGDELRDFAVTALREHAGALQHAGAEAGRTLAHIIVGLGIGVLAALHDVRNAAPIGPLAQALEERVRRLGKAFQRVVFAQVRISALNSILTTVYLLVVLPIAGVHLPLAKTMIALTFLVGLLPVVGNLVSNTVIVILSLSVSLPAAIGSLVFLIIIHKLEYFLNAHIVGSRVHAQAWELLLAMLVMEAAFGIPGLVAAPIYYAYIKDELMSRKLV
jgi:predicted PurR-regulated permease PerM